MGRVVSAQCTACRVLVVALLFVLSANAQRQGNSRPSKNSGPLPFARLDQNVAEEPVASLRRHSRELRHKDFYRLLSDPGKHVEGEAETILVRSYNYHGAFEPFPASQASVVATGLIIKAQAHVSRDRTYVYSDFTFKIDGLLKSEPALNLSQGSVITVSRAGASVQFPSGHVRHYLIEGQGMPKIGSRYLLFLTRDDPTNPFDFVILVAGAYELDGSKNKVWALDDFNESMIDSLDVNSLLLKARNAVEASPR